MPDMMSDTILSDFERRELVAQMTAEQDLREHLQSGSRTNALSQCCA